MAKAKPTQSDRARGRLLYVEFDGGNDAFANACQTLAAAIQGPTSQARDARPVITASRTAIPVVEAQVPIGDDDPQRTFDFHPADEEDGDGGRVADASRKKRGEGERIDRNAKIVLVGDIDFVPKEKQPLKELFAQKNPGSDLDQVLVICYFLQHIAHVNPIGPGHVLSGFKHVGKPVPKDLKQTIRNLKKNKAWLGFSKINDIRLTTEGDNRVEHELGKPNGERE